MKTTLQLQPQDLVDAMWLHMRPRLRSVTRLLAFLSLVLLCACKPSTTIESFADDAKEQMALSYIQRLIDGDVTALTQELHPSLRSENELAQFNAMRALIPAGKPDVTNLVGYDSFNSSEVHRYNLTYQFGYGAKWIVIHAAWNELPGGKRQIVGMHVYPLSEPLQKTHAFTFQRAGAQHYVFFAAAILMPIFTVVTLIVCIRTKVARRKWLWIVFILFGLGQVSLNWTTGQFGISLLSFVLFSASAMASSIYSPWIISFSLPLGAILFWVFRSRLAKPKPIESQPTEASSPTAT